VGRNASIFASYHRRLARIALSTLGVVVFASLAIVAWAGGPLHQVNPGVDPVDPVPPGRVAEEGLHAQVNPDLDIDPEEGGVEALVKAMRFGDARPATDREDLPQARQIAQRRYEIAGEILESKLRDIFASRGILASRGKGDLGERLGPYLEWSRRRMEAGLELSTGGADQARVLDREIEQVENLVAALKEIEQGAGSAVSLETVREAEFYGLELKSRLAKLKD
jgi:hypothetical protein